MKCEWAKGISQETWNRIKLAHSLSHVKIYETTITQNIIFSLIERKIKDVKIFESSDERSNGRDLEVYLSNNTGNYYKFAVQAKAVYRNGKFQAIRHISDYSKAYQINDLIRHARLNRFIPIYFLYSYSNMFNGNDRNSFGQLYSHYGISVASAHQIRMDYFDLARFKWSKTPKATDIICDRKVITFPDFICSEIGYYHFMNLIFEPMAFTGILPNQDFTCSKDEIYQNNKWRSLDSSEDNIERKHSDFDYNGYNPKYRIVFDNANQ